MHQRSFRKPRGFLRVFLFVALAATVALAQAGTALAQSPGPRATLSVDRDSFAAGEDVVVRLSVSNDGAAQLGLLRWMTPEPGIEGPIFVVTLDGQAVDYLGVKVKRVSPSAADYLAVEPGQALSWEVVLSASWDFHASGRYAIRYEAASPSLYAPSSGPVVRPDVLVSNDVEVFVEGRAPRARARVFPRSVTGTNGFSGCSAGEMDDLVAARDTASVYAADAVDYLTASTVDSRYLTWFGNYDALRYATVTDNFVAIQAAIDTAAPMNFDCTCTDGGTYAYVYPSAPYDVYLCGAFWSAPASGDDSKPGVLIHEVSHFNIVAGTDDHVYGQVGAAQLAANNPDLAVDNADNHEYFAEAYGEVAPPDAECAAVAPSCEAAGKGSLRIKDNGDPAKRSMQWAWSLGTVSASSLGDPADATNYRLCFYDGSSLLSAPQLGVESGFLWSSNANGYKYSNKGGNVSGVFQVSLKAGSGNAKLQVKARGSSLDLPALPWAPSSDLLVQLVKDGVSGSECWETTFTPGDVVSTDTQFKASVP